ncbi:hypothetical protein WR25_26132 [Diploscapter pachys]|uniref:Cyclin-like domain-containing protein n=1 Tax=Diploscapter pachys TaxID=2018661 RepID=A0A2A2J5I7_9BILA|nr:hypothetical protein WR25_26132 [Diploscapter pachys]
MSSIAEQPNSSSNAGYAAGTGGAVGSVSDFGKDAQRWNFDRDDMEKAASIVVGMSLDEELKLRQKAAAAIQDMSEALNANVKDQRSRISHLCTCVAIVQMHRFFYFHSFKFFDYRDVAAACLFLAGKSEECPRKLEYVVKIWWDKKFGQPIPSQNHGVEAAQLIVQLENLILRTIGFDLNVELPHQHVLKNMPTGGISQSDFKSMASSAYYFATDILCMSNWPIRYNSRTIAAACVYIVSIWANIQIPNGADPTVPWYKVYDRNITLERLIEMANEFATIYQDCKDHLAIRSTFLQQKKGGATSIGDPEAEDSTSGQLLLPPPPPPPITPAAPVKIGLNQYRERIKEEQKDTPTTSNVVSDTPSVPQKRSFIPDTSAVTMKQELKQEPRNEHLSGHSGNGNGQLQNGSSRREHKDSHSSHHSSHHHSSSHSSHAQPYSGSHSNGEQRHHKSSSSHGHKEHKDKHHSHHHHKRDGPPSMNSSSIEHKEARLESDRRKEEERRKREYEKMSGASIHGSSSNSEKRSQIDSLKMSFVPSSENHRHKIKLPMPPGPLHDSATLISPPPNLSEIKAHDNKMEMEEGEVE